MREHAHADLLIGPTTFSPVAAMLVFVPAMFNIPMLLQRDRQS
jgi:hypothetical protein